MPASLDQVRPAVASKSSSVDVELSFRCAGLVVTRWRCRVREAGESAVISHRWQTMNGAFQAHLSDGPVLDRPLSAFRRPRHLLIQDAIRSEAL